MKKITNFFDRIYRLGVDRNGSLPLDIRSMVITHLLPTSLEYIRYIHSVWPVASVIGIPYSMDPIAVEELRKLGIEVKTPRRLEEIPQMALETVNELQQQDLKVVIQEVGGYLSEYLNILKQFGNVVGIVEDTAQGHWRYKKHEKGQLPILSIAFSTLKNVEDTLIGDAVVYSLERVLRENYRDVIQGKTSLVLGYGKIGRSCGIALKGRESHVSIYDSNPILNLTARLEGYKTGNVSDLLQQAELIVGATGSTSLDARHFDLIQDGAILVSASSRDIEFDLHSLEAYKLEDDPLIWKCKNGRGTFYVLNQGRPINFRDNSILGPYLYLVYGELLYCMLKVCCSPIEYGLQETSEEERMGIAKEFYEEFYGGWLEPDIKARRPVLSIMQGGE